MNIHTLKFRPKALSLSQMSHSKRILKYFNTLLSATAIKSQLFLLFFDHPFSEYVKYVCLWICIVLQSILRLILTNNVDFDYQEWLVLPRSAVKRKKKSSFWTTIQWNDIEKENSKSGRKRIKHINRTEKYYSNAGGSVLFRALYF